MADEHQAEYQPTDAYLEWRDDGMLYSHEEILAEIEAWDWDAPMQDGSPSMALMGGQNSSAYPSSFDKDLDLIIQSREGPKIQQELPAPLTDSQSQQDNAASVVADDHLDPALLSTIPPLIPDNAPLENMTWPTTQLLNQHMSQASHIAPHHVNNPFTSYYNPNSSQHVSTGSAVHQATIPNNSATERDNSPNATQNLAHAHLTPLSPEYAAAQEVLWQAATRIRSSSLRPGTPMSQYLPTENALQTLAPDLGHHNPAQSIHKSVLPYRINSPGNTPSHGIPAVGTLQAEQHNGLSHHEVTPIQQFQPVQGNKILKSHPQNTFNLPSMAEFIAGSQPSPFPQFQNQPVANVPFTPARQSYEWSEFMNPPKDLTQASCEPIFDASAEPTFRAHDTPPDAEEHAKQASKSSQTMGDPENDLPKLGLAQANALDSRGGHSRSFSRTFPGTPVRSDLIMKETNWGEHVLTPTMTREISSRNHSPSASPKKNTTPVLSSPSINHKLQEGTPTRNIKPNLDGNKRQPGQQPSPAQLVENAMAYAYDVAKADKVLTQSPEPSTPLQSRALQATCMTTEVLRLRLRSLGERVSGPKRELIRRMLQQEVKQGQIKADGSTTLTENAPATETVAGLKDEGKAIASKALLPVDSGDLTLLPSSPGSNKSTEPEKKRGRPPGKLLPKPRMETWVDPGASATVQQYFPLAIPGATPNALLEAQDPVPDPSKPYQTLATNKWASEGLSMPPASYSKSVEQTAIQDEIVVKVDEKKHELPSARDSLSISPGPYYPAARTSITPAKRKRALRSSDKQTKPTDADDESDHSDEGTRHAKQAKKKPKQTPKSAKTKSRGSASTPRKGKPKTGSAASKPGPLSRELLALHLPTPPSAKNGGRILRKTAERLSREMREVEAEL